jgi:dUTP pyrophosphatase
MKIVRLDKSLPIPTYAYDGDAGVDLYASIEKEVILYPTQTVIIPNGIAVQIEKGKMLSIRGRSGLAFKHGVSIVHGTGTIDNNYRGEIKTCLINHGNETFVIKHGDRIAQAILQEVCTIEFEEVDSLDETERNENGFGSSGK